MSASDDVLETARSTPPPRMEIGPAPTGDHTSLWIRLGLLSIVALLVLRIVVRVRRDR